MKTRTSIKDKAETETANESCTRTIDVSTSAFTSGNSSRALPMSSTRPTSTPARNTIHSRGRQLQLWVKHSLLSSVVNTSTTSTKTTNGIKATTTASLTPRVERALHRPQPQESSIPWSPYNLHLIRGPLDETSSFTIDDALESFSYYRKASDTSILYQNDGTCNDNFDISNRDKIEHNSPWWQYSTPERQRERYAQFEQEYQRSQELLEKLHWDGSFEFDPNFHSHHRNVRTVPDSETRHEDEQVDDHECGKTPSNSVDDENENTLDVQPLQFAQFSNVSISAADNADTDDVLHFGEFQSHLPKPAQVPFPSEPSTENGMDRTPIALIEISSNLSKNADDNGMDRTPIVVTEISSNLSENADDNYVLKAKNDDLAHSPLDLDNSEANDKTSIPFQDNSKVRTSLYQDEAAHQEQQCFTILKKNSSNNIENKDVHNQINHADQNENRMNFFSAPKKVMLNSGPKTPVTNNYTHGRDYFKSESSLSPSSSGFKENSEDSRSHHSNNVRRQLLEQPSLDSPENKNSLVMDLFEDKRILPMNGTNTETPNSIPSTVEFPINLPPKQGYSTPINKMHQEYRDSLMEPLQLSLNMGYRVASTLDESRSHLTSPESRFFRRTNQMRTLLLGKYEKGIGDNDSEGVDDNASLASLGSLRSLLPDGFRQASFALPTEDVMNEVLLDTLRELEWEWVPYWKMESLLDNCDESFVPLWREQLVEKLSFLDATHSSLMKKVYRSIQSQAQELEKANHTALNLTKNLQLCNMYLRRSQSSIYVARFGVCQERYQEKKDTVGGTEGAKQLLLMWEARDSYSSLHNIVTEIKVLFEKEQDILKRIENLNLLSKDTVKTCSDIISSIENLRNELLTSEMCRLECLDDLRVRADQLQGKVLVDRLYTWLEIIIRRSCHGSNKEIRPFDADEYSILINAILLTESIGLSPTEAASSMSTRIHTTLLLESQKAFGMALLNPTDWVEESQYEQELSALNANAYLDPSRTGIWIQNLVTIRFDFEVGQNNLSAIFHKLCLHLTDILKAHHQVILWHESNVSGWNTTLKDETMQCVHSNLLQRQISIWNTCLQGLEECIDEYLKTAPKKTLFAFTTDMRCDNDSEWFADLLGINDVVHLSEQFLSLQGVICDNTMETLVNDGSLLRQKLEELQKRHVQIVHTQSMNHIGQLLYQEKWIDGSQSGENAVQSLDEMFESLYTQMVFNHKRKNTLRLRSRLNWFRKDTSLKTLLLAPFNPFEDILTSDDLNEFTTVYLKEQSLVLKILKQQLRNSYEVAPTLLSSLYMGVVPWMSRLSLLINLLPDVEDESTKIISSINNLYFTTVFRLCAGNTINERILLGLKINDTPSSEGISSADSKVYLSKPNPNSRRLPSNTTTANMFGFQRSLSSSFSSGKSTGETSFSTNIALTTEAELCSPRPCEAFQVKNLAVFLMKAQKSLESVVKLNLVDTWLPDAIPGESRSLIELATQSAEILEKRQQGIWSCGIVALCVEMIEINHTSMKQHISSETELREVVNQIQSIVPVMLNTCSRIACMRAIRGRVIVKQILMVGSVWEESKFQETHNAYVDAVCDFVAYLYHSLGKRRNHSKKICENVLWKHIIEGVFSCMLDGFSRIKHCSTEGRALMRMDLDFFSKEMLLGKGLAARLKGVGHYAARPQQPIESDYCTNYVEAYIKVFYYPLQDAFDWIKENYTKYRMKYMISLLEASVDERSASDLKHFLTLVRNLYSSSSSALANQTPKIASI